MFSITSFINNCFVFIDTDFLILKLIVSCGTSSKYKVSKYKRLGISYVFSVYYTHTPVIRIIGNTEYALKVSGENYADTQAADINSIKQDMHQLMSRVVCGFGVHLESLFGKPVF